MRTVDMIVDGLNIQGAAANQVHKDLTWLFSVAKDNAQPQVYQRIGSVALEAAQGIQLINPDNGQVSVHLDADGDVFVGSDIDTPADTSFVVFSNDQTYNTEAFGAGDLLIGDNSSGKANLLWDVSTGQLKFRGGQTTKTYIDVDGTINATDGVFSGSITATTGTIGGWSIGTYTIASGTDVVLTSFPAGGISVADGDANLDSTGLWVLADDVGSVQTKTIRFLYDKPTVQTFAQLLTYYSGSVGSYFQIAAYNVNAIDTDLVITTEADMRMEGDWAGPPYGAFLARQFSTYTFEDATTFTISDATTINISGDLLINSDTADIWMGAGSDIRIGKSAANTLRIYDNLVVDLNITAATGTVDVATLKLGGGPTITKNLSNNISLNNSTDIAGTFTALTSYISSKVDGSSGGFKAGALEDVHLYRLSANVWYTPDNFRAAGYFYSQAANALYLRNDSAKILMGSADDIEISRYTANQLLLNDHLIIQRGLAVGSTRAPAADDISYDGNLSSYKNATEYAVYGYHPLSSRLESANFNGDSYSTAAKTKIDVSAEFSITTANIKAYLVQCFVRDSGSDGSAARGFCLDPTATADLGVFCMCGGLANDAIARNMLVVHADANGDFYIQKYASGTNTLDIWIQIYGYWI